MSTIRNFFRSVFSQAYPSSDSPASFDLTLHDAMRLREHSVPRAADKLQSHKLRANPQIRILHYDCVADLRVKLRRLDAPGNGSTGLHVVLVLDGELNCDLGSLIARDTLACRLVVVKLGRRLPGMLSLADVTLLAPKLGWLQIELGSDLSDDIEATLKSLDKEDRLVILFPRRSVAQRRLM